MPVLRWQYFNGEYKSISISESIKITRFTNCNLLAERVFSSLQNALTVYSLNGVEIDLLMLSKPWLSADDFNVQMPEITKTLNDQIEKEISYLSKNSIKDQINFSNKANKLKYYIYKDIVMDNYGEPVLNKNNLLIGYKLDFN